MPAVIWYEERGREEIASTSISNRVADVTVALRSRPGFWGEISQHLTQNAANVQANRWRRRWRRLGWTEYKARVKDLHAGEDLPWALLLSFQPADE